MATNDVKVLGAWPSPYVNRVQMALMLKSVDYELIETNPHQKSELLIKSNPVHKKIPVLIHSGVPICESLIIIQYIDETWPEGPSILPSDPYDRAIARFWAAYIDDKWSPLLKQLGKDETKAVEEEISAGLVLLDEAFVECSRGGHFFGGDSVGYLDMALGCQWGWIGACEALTGIKFLDADRIPNLVAWAERMYCASPVKDAMLKAEALVEVFKKFKAASGAAAAHS